MIRRDHPSLRTVSSTVPPAAGIFFSLSAAKNAICWLSGDQNGMWAFCVPSSALAVSASSGRIHSSSRAARISGREDQRAAVWRNCRVGGVKSQRRTFRSEHGHRATARVRGADRSAGAATKNPIAVIDATRRGRANQADARSAERRRRWFADRHVLFD